MKKMNLIFPAWLTIGIALFVCGAAAFAGNGNNGSDAIMLDIKSQPLADALHEFARQSGVQVLFYSDVADEGLKVAGLAGSFALDRALNQLLVNTGLSWSYVNSKTVAIRRTPSGEKSTSSDASSRTHLAGLRAAEVQTAAEARESGTADTQESAGAQQDNKVQEIVVTAQKREQRVFDVPMSIAVIGGEDIERRGLIGMEDYLRSVPGVNQIDQGPTSNAVVIRGITTSPQYENFSSGTSVGMYFDETNITAAGGLGAGSIDIRPVDLARIEVLRGPQGTTFGSASLGGAVRLIPQRPVLNTFAGSVSSAFSETAREGGTNSMIQGMLNVPVVTDRLALRGVAYRFEDSGTYRNVIGENAAALALANSFNVGGIINGYTQDDIGQVVSTGARLSAALAVNDRTDATLIYLTQTIEQDGWPLSTLDGYNQARFPVAPQARLRGETGELADTNIDLASAVVNVDMGPVALTTALSWLDSGSQSAATATSTTNPRSSTNGSEFRNKSGEIRVQSTYEGPLQFLAGVFYEDIQEYFFQTSDWPGAPATNPFSTAPILFYELTRDLTQLAVFGEVSYDLTDRFTVTGGGRWFKYDKSETELREGALANRPLGTGVRGVFDNDDAETSWKGTLSYKASTDALLYATWSQGFRLGRATAGLPAGACDLDNNGILDGTGVTLDSTRIVNSDFLDNSEIGTKLAFADRRVLIDAAVYHIEWDGMPIRQGAPCGSFTANVGSATSDGLELQVRLLPLQGLQIDIGGGYNNAELAEDAPGISAVKGARLPGAPEFNANLGVQYDFPAFGLDAFVRTDALYAGKFHGDLQETVNTLSGDYVKFDVRAGVRLNALRVEIFAKNLTNEDAYSWRGLSNANSFFGYRLRPRTVGVELGYSFQ